MDKLVSMVYNGYNKTKEAHDMKCTPKKTVPVTKYVVQCLNPGGGWFPYEKSVEDKEAAKKIQRKARNETGCRTRIVAFETNKYVED